MTELKDLTNKRIKEIVFNGMSGQKPKIPLRLDLLANKALASLPAKKRAFLDGRVGYENIITQNNKAFLKWAIVPHVLKDISQIDTDVDLFGINYSYPFMLGPIGMHKLVNKIGEPAVAKAAAAEDIAMVFSTQASTPMETVAASMGDAKRWYQLYWTQSDELNHSLIRRAEACGCTALVVTVDVSVYGWRTEELSLGYNPFFHNFHGWAQYSSDPVFQKLVDEYSHSKRKRDKVKINLTTISNLITMTRNYPGNFFKNLISMRAINAANVLIEIYGKPSLNWQDIADLKKITKLPILVKGVLHPDDAKRAIEYGIDGIVISSHGGRQLSGSITSIEALPPIVKVIKNKIPIIFDSGIRGGADIFKAIALGANMVFIGRAYVHALALAGEKGVRELIQNLKAEFAITMALTGCTNIKEITSDKLTRVD